MVCVAPPSRAPHLPAAAEALTIPSLETRAEVAAWFDSTFEVTDGCFTSHKSAHEKRFGTVLNLELVWLAWLLREGERDPRSLVAKAKASLVTKGAFESILKDHGVNIRRSVHNAWVGSMFKACACRFRDDYTRSAQIP